MKKLVIGLALAAFSITAAACKEPKPDPKTKLVCIEQLDSKTQKPVQVCKTIKLHEKLEGTPVPKK